MRRRRRETRDKRTRRLFGPPTTSHAHARDDDEVQLPLSGRTEKETVLLKEASFCPWTRELRHTEAVLLTRRLQTDLQNTSLSFPPPLDPSFLVSRALTPDSKAHYSFFSFSRVSVLLSFFPNFNQPMTKEHGDTPHDNLILDFSVLSLFHSLLSSTSPTISRLSFVSKNASGVFL